MAKRDSVGAAALVAGRARARLRPDEWLEVLELARTGWLRVAAAAAADFTGARQRSTACAALGGRGGFALPAVFALLRCCCPCAAVAGSGTGTAAAVDVLRMVGAAALDVCGPRRSLLFGGTDVARGCALTDVAAYGGTTDESGELVRSTAVPVAATVAARPVCAAARAL